MPDAAEEDLLRFIADAPATVTFADLKRRFCADDGLCLSDLKRLVARLIQRRRLCYQAKFGRTTIDLSYDRPVQVSAHVLLSPPHRTLALERGQVAVLLEKGSAFGSGEHPSTRLAVQLIDAMLQRSPWAEQRASLRALDIGTGSGVLALVAAKLGVGRVWAVDTDPIAVCEAGANVGLNGLNGRVHVSDRPFGAVNAVIDLFFANLRTPTLLTLLDDIGRLAATESGLVLSGIKDGEAGWVLDVYTSAGYALLEKRRTKGWCALCFTRGEFPPPGGAATS